MSLKKRVNKCLQALLKRLDEGGEDVGSDSTPEAPPVPFDNSYPWLVTYFVKLMQDPLCSRRPHYIYGVLQGAALAKVLGLERISVLEIGVGSGAGLLSMEQIAERCEELVDIKIDVYGFDTGIGQPKPVDYRDSPQRWLEGYYPLDEELLKKRLRRASLKLGLVRDTIPEFLQSSPSPIAYVAFEMGTYSSTKDAFQVFEADDGLLLPRTPCSFRCAIGKDYCEYTGELLAVSEFNASHQTRKIQLIRTLSLFFPYPFNCMWWIEMMYTFHSFNHPLYNSPEAYQQPVIIDLDDNEIYKPVPRSGKFLMP